MTEKVNGLWPIVGREALTGNIQFYSVSVVEDIRPATDAASQARLQKLIECISLNGQPIILGDITGTGPFVLKFAIEHEGSWINAAALNAAALLVGLTVTTTVGEVL
jgi:hypothetical protein